MKRTITYSSIMPILLILSNNLLAQVFPYQKGSYVDDFHYLQGKGSAQSNSFNNWYYAMYPNDTNSYTIDNYVSFVFNDSTINGSSYCSNLTVKKTPGSQAPYQDAEMFNNVCVAGQPSPNPPSQPDCNLPFPYNRLKNSQPPYSMSNSIADSGSLYHAVIVNLGQCNSPYYPSDSVAYKITMRVKAEGPTYGTRGWGFWNTQFQPTTSSPDYFAWFYEWGINLDLTDTIKLIPLVFPTAITLNDESVTLTVLLVNAYDYFYDYEIIWSAKAVEYYINNSLVAIHNNPPKADSNHGMAFHNWVDNRLYCKTCGLGTYAPIPMDKSNYLDKFKAEPVYHYVKNTSTPFSLFTVSYPLSMFSAAKLSNVKDSQSNGKPVILESLLEKVMNEHGDKIKNLLKGKYGLHK
jgi:hypothetical protein